MTDYDPNSVNRTDITPWRDETTVRYYYIEKGYSLKETGETLGCAECTVLQWCRKHGIETRDPQEARETGTPEELENKEWVRREYIEKERTMRDISAELGVTDLTVSRWVRRHDLPTRPRNRPRERHTTNCVACGSSFEVIQSRSDRAKYCSRECYYDDLDMPTGEDHWSWKNTPKYRPKGEEWQNLRSEVRERDGYECRVCGVSESELGHELDVHHLERVRDMDNPRGAVNVDTDLLVSLCRSCHRRVERISPFLPPSLD